MPYDTDAFSIVTSEDVDVSVAIILSAFLATVSWNITEIFEEYRVLVTLLVSITPFFLYRMLLFSYDPDNTFWTSKYGNDWNSKTVDQGAIHTLSSLNEGQYRFYNYPNPVREGSTTFRFLYSANNMTPLIKLYDVLYI